MADVWPEVARRLRAQLRHQRFDGADLEDVLQEVALRAVKFSPTFESADDLLPWAAVVARRLITDLQRKSGRTIDLTDEHTSRSTADVESAAVARVQLDQIRQALSANPASWKALFATPADDGATRNREAVQRHRLRARLAQLIGGLGAALGWLRRHVRAVAVVAVAALATISILELASQVPHGQLPSARGKSTLTPAAVQRSRADPQTRATGASEPGLSAGGRANTTVTVDREVRVPVPGYPTPARAGIRPSEDTDLHVCLNNLPVTGTRCVHTGIK